MCGFGGPVVTRVRELLTPKPLRELRVKTDYLHHQTIDGAAGIKICANHLENVVAGSACLVPFKDVNNVSSHPPAVNRRAPPASSRSRTCRTTSRRSSRTRRARLLFFFPAVFSFL